MSPHEEQASGAPVSTEPAPLAIQRKRLRFSVKTVRWVVPAALIVVLLVAGVYGYNDGYRLITVHGGSMGDTIPIGSVVVAKMEPAAAVRLGDVVLISEREEDGTVATPKIHRIVNLREEGGQVIIQAKGDHNSAPDPGEYILADGTLVTQWHVPRLGYWMAFVLTVPGWLLTIALPFSLTLVLGIVSIWRSDKRPTAVS